jgi:hypothetical protein
MQFFVAGSMPLRTEFWAWSPAIIFEITTVAAILQVAAFGLSLERLKL